jgi:hypothetical protein
MFGNGFKDTVQKDGTWRIIANSRPYDGRGFAMDMALHRAAELAAAAGRTHFQIIDNNGTLGTGLYVRGRETVKLIVRPADSLDAPLECRAKNTQNCGTFEVAEVVARIGPTLRRK